MVILFLIIRIIVMKIQCFSSSMIYTTFSILAQSSFPDFVFPDALYFFKIQRHKSKLNLGTKVRKTNIQVSIIYVSYRSVYNEMIGPGLALSVNRSQRETENWEVPRGNRADSGLTSSLELQPVLDSMTKSKVYLTSRKKMLYSPEIFVLWLLFHG